MRQGRIPATPQVVAQKYETRKVAALKHFPGNPRTGNVEAIRGSIDVNGFYGALVVQKSTGYVVAGNHRLMAAKEAGLKELPCLVLDVTDEEATRIMLADNRTAMMGTDDPAAILALIEESLAGEPAGTGYTSADIDRMLAELNSTAPGEFPTVDPDTIQTEHRCPKCKYEWSGKSK